MGAGSIVFVHSSLSSMGYVDGGADAVVDALVEVLGAEGTLAVPTFTFVHGGKTKPLFDPQRDPAEMGRIAEVTRTRPGARRSRHLLHSIAALGGRADELTVHHGPSAWAADGPFWKLYELDAHLLLLGVPYTRCTFFHMMEQLVQVPYRQWSEVEARIRERDGTESPLPTKTFSPQPGFVGNDFNKLGTLLEEQGKVQMGTVGNAIARFFKAREALEFGLVQYRRDPYLFIRAGDSFTELGDGELILEQGKVKWVADATRAY